MDNKIKAMLTELTDHINDDDLNVYEEKIVSELENYEDKEAYIEEIFGIMEKFPLTDWGMPGALAGFLESFDNDIYEKNLLDSLSRQPALQTVWMLNRQINSIKAENKGPYLQIMKNIANDTSLDKEITESAKEFADYQERAAASASQPRNGNHFNSLEQIFNMFNFIPKDK